MVNGKLKHLVGLNNFENERKLKNLFCVTTNKKTHQESWHLKSKEFRMRGLSSRQLLEMSIPEPNQPVTKLK